MKKTLIISVIIIFLVLALGISQLKTTEGNNNSGETWEVDEVIKLTSEGDFKFHLNGEENPDIVVNQGSIVRIEFANNDFMPHDWVVDEFNAATEIINQGQIAFVEFKADKKGVFEYYCSVGQHRLRGMFGNLIVE